MIVLKSTYDKVVASLNVALEIARSRADSNARTGRDTIREVGALQQAARHFANLNREIAAHTATKKELARVQADLDRWKGIAFPRMYGAAAKSVPYCAAVDKGFAACCNSTPCKLQPIAGCAGNKDRS